MWYELKMSSDVPFRVVMSRVLKPSRALERTGMWRREAESRSAAMCIGTKSRRAAA